MSCAAVGHDGRLPPAIPCPLQALEAMLHGMGVEWIIVPGMKQVDGCRCLLIGFKPNAKFAVGSGCSHALLALASRSHAD